MNPVFRFGPLGDDRVEVLLEDGELALYRVRREHADGNEAAVLGVRPTDAHPKPAILDRLAHEYSLKDELDSAWAVRPLELVRAGGRPLLLLEDPGGEPLERLLGAPMEAERFLRLAVGIASALGRVHRRGLIHKDIKPANILVNRANTEARLTGFGIASRLPRERQVPEPPETIAGTLAYMAPEQTGRMNRSVDARSDLYALGATFYQMLTGVLPFTADGALEWVHCHIARKPVPPCERLDTVPAPLSQIVMKLLAKTAEERYQSAGGVEHDLRRCLHQWETLGRIAPFPLGERDIPDRLLIPEKLYGREREVETLLAAFERIVHGGAPELVLVSGYSGIGKSAVVRELHKVLVPPRGLFAAGKFDQYRRDIPYSSLAQAFRSLVRPLLSKSEAELSGWRAALLEALGPNGQLMVDLVPELELIIGEPPRVPPLEPKQAQGRFQLVFRRFLGVFARPEHPLALFLDDLQWVDAATLDLLEDLLTRPDVQYLMLIGAYRDNEVTVAHPLRRKLAAIQTAGGRVTQITLAPLAREHLSQLVADALRCEPARAAPLAQLLHEKTGGNPFFAIQFVASLADEGMLTFDHEAARWSWDLDRIRAKGYTDNVADLMVGKLDRLPAETKMALQQLACLGNVAELATLSVVVEMSEEQVHAALWPAVRQEYLERRSGAYRFIHDRVQEAAYSLTPRERRGAAHLRIGRLLAAHTPPDKREEAVFGIVNQLNCGSASISSPEEREALAELNLLAGKRAKASTAYASALSYLNAGAALLVEADWERRHELTFGIQLLLAECEFLTGALAAADERLNELSRRAATLLERANVTCLRLDLYVTLDQASRAIAVALDYLGHLGIDWSPHPTEEIAREEYDRIWSQLGNRTIDELIELPLMTDPESLATMDVLTKTVPAALYTDANLWLLVISRAVNLSLERGNCDGSASAYVRLGMMAGARFGHYKVGFQFGQLGYDLVERRGLMRFQARTYMHFGNVILPLARHVRVGRELLRRGFEAAKKTGDLIFESYCYNHMTANMLAAGDRLADVQQEAQASLTFAQKAHFGFSVDVSATQLGLVRTLRGLTPTFGRFDDEQFDESQIERHFLETPDLAVAQCWYWIRKLQARFFAGDYAAALDASLRAQRLLWTSASYLEEAEYHFFSALSLGACCDTVSGHERQAYLEAIAAHKRQLQLRAETCPENFENRAALVGAEIARIEGHDAEAMRLYEQAIRSAHDNGFVHHEALANELAARFYLARGCEKAARVYMQDARYGYLRWGADGKVRQLDQTYPVINREQPTTGAVGTIGAPVEQLDLAIVLKVSQAVSGEIVLDKLLDTLMRTAIEQAGGERGLLVLTRGGEPRIQAAAAVEGDSLVVQVRDERVTTAMLPESVLHYVMRTRESVTLDDAVNQDPFGADPYICQQQVRSVLCLPLINQGEPIGALYLENNLTPGAFAPARIAVLKLLASQAAMTLENARLYRGLAEREAKIRRLVDANIIGIFMWRLEGETPEAADAVLYEVNDAFLRIVGYDRDDFLSGRVRRSNLTPPEWRARTAQAHDELMRTGTFQPYEKEYLRKDGTRVPVLVGTAAIEGGRQGVAFVLDLTGRKRVEAEMHEVERRYREAQTALEHATRVATMGQLVASITHEIKQPIAANAMSAQAGLRWLSAQPPDWEHARRAFDQIVEGAKRASEVANWIRGLVKNAPPSKQRLQIGEAIAEVIALTRAEAEKNSVSLRTQLADNLPLVEGDRIQLQQVTLNLVLNAIEAMSAIDDGARELTISSGTDDSGDVLISVCDSGPGVAAEDAERVFEPFYTTKASGMGMGLSICRSIMEAHGGRLWVTANVPCGAAFQFTVPVLALTGSASAGAIKSG
ncbi:trifunctional serine/threonine-protein kinase/ATP-binding protein/sensor histidine kinase [Paraburkholderia sp. UCT31]|uniref:trifunctional serine/threonine-protein kinase/ATP-binding protein/sensor histidine kinase n=1 Tax=Paraburkholderia sp. UCT31 TaxID=2615209 RepID=UPI00223BC1E3|nr:trifunctional serine/threonine-protein kinase/ATP-binding protein/sensor histidine kinase [Paraburkholderia sp. UCT31]